MTKKRMNLGIEGWALIVGILSLIIAALSWYQSTFQIGVRDADTFRAVFNANGNPEARMETKVHWSKGEIYYGVTQNYGIEKTTKYDIFFRRDSGSWISEWSNGYVNRNNYYQGAYYMHYTTGLNRYGYKLLKKTNLGTSSRLEVALMLH